MSDITVNNFKAFYEQIRPYLGAVHSGFTPIGTVISVMGTTAPLNYLACDGTVYNIADYTELAAYFNQQFGSSNFFGGDGTTTFAVPDLRGEFLRGTGTNSHANQGSGANVGEHQDGTEHRYFAADTYGNIYWNGITNNDNRGSNKRDKDVNLGNINAKAVAGANGTTGEPSHFTSRPTNTSVLYCIASKNIFMDAGSNYSTEEQVVGTWIDGKPIYQKTVSCGNFQSQTTRTIPHGISNLDKVIQTSWFGKADNGILFCNNYVYFNIAQSGDYVQGGDGSIVYVDDANIYLMMLGNYVASNDLYKNVYVTLQYTKTS